MKCRELKKRLIDENISQYYYSFDEEYLNEAFCMIKKIQDGKYTIWLN